jgi:hypothetical protein
MLRVFQTSYRTSPRAENWRTAPVCVPAEALCPVRLIRLSSVHLRCRWLHFVKELWPMLCDYLPQLGRAFNHSRFSQRFVDRCEVVHLHRALAAERLFSFHGALIGSCPRFSQFSQTVNVLRIGLFLSPFPDRCQSLICSFARAFARLTATLAMEKSGVRSGL